MEILLCDSFSMLQRMEEKQAELDNPVESWNLSVKDVRKILSRKHRHRRSASNDDVIREGDYPMDDDDDNDSGDDEGQQKVGGAKGRASTAGEEQPTKEPIAEFPISSSRRRTRSSTSSSRDRQQPEQHNHHHHYHHHHREHHHHSHHHRETRSSSSSSASVVSPVISVSPVMLAAAAASVDPSSRATAGGGIPPTSAAGRKAPPTGTGVGPPFPLQPPASAQKQLSAPIPQPSALPPPHLKTPVTMVISRDPRVAKRQQQQLLEKTQGPPTSSNQQAEGSQKTGTDSKSPSPAAAAVMEASPQKSAETDEARMRERLLLRQKYRIRKASDRRDSKDDSPEDVQQSPTATHPPPLPPPGSSLQPSPTSAAPAPIKSCLVVKGSPPTNKNTAPPAVEADAHVQSSSAQQEQPALSEQGASLRPVSQPPGPRPGGQQGFVGSSSVAGESVEQSTGELELSPHKKAVFFLDTKAAPIDVTSLPPIHGSDGSRSASTTHEVLPDSRVEPETGEVESMNSMSTQGPGQATVGTGSSEAQAEAEATPATTDAQSKNETRPESDDDEKDDSSDSSDEDERDESEGGAKRAGGVAIGKCYMDREGEEEEQEEMGVASDKETKEEER